MYNVQEVEDLIILLDLFAIHKSHMWHVIW